MAGRASAEARRLRKEGKVAQAKVADPTILRNLNGIPPKLDLRVAQGARGRARAPQADLDSRLAGPDDAGLASALERLVEADILLVDGVGRQANYRFKHALIQDAAYESLLKSRRQALHRRAAESLRDQSGRAAVEPSAHLQVLLKFGAPWDC
jgi:hypothetical protein